MTAYKRADEVIRNPGTQACSWIIGNKSYTRQTTLKQWGSSSVHSFILNSRCFFDNQTLSENILTLLFCAWETTLPLLHCWQQQRKTGRTRKFRFSRSTFIHLLSICGSFHTSSPRNQICSLYFLLVNCLIRLVTVCLLSPSRTSHLTLDWVEIWTSKKLSGSFTTCTHYRVVTECLQSTINSFKTLISPLVFTLLNQMLNLCRFNITSTSYFGALQWRWDTSG